jgi:voltage-gated potassium channel
VDGLAPRRRGCARAGTRVRGGGHPGARRHPRTGGRPVRDEEASMNDDLARRRALFDRVERASRVPMLFLAVVWLLALAIPELLDLPPEVHDTVEVASWFIWAIFAFELILMTYLAENRRRYLIEHWPDVLTVLLPFLRPLRLLRIAILSLRVWTEAKALIRERTLSVVAITSLLCIWATATLMYLAERGGEGPIQSFPDALWWAVATITTVGYGDVYPKTPEGRGVAFLLMLIGISMFGLVTARVAAFFVDTEEHRQADARLEEIAARLERIERALGAGAPPSAAAPEPEAGRQGPASDVGAERRVGDEATPRPRPR